MSMTGSTNSFCAEATVGIESSLAAAGCIFNDEGEITGKVFLCKKSDDIVGSQVEYELVAHFFDGSEPIAPYTGEWGDCSNCETNSNNAPGLITQF